MCIVHGRINFIDSCRLCTLCSNELLGTGSERREIDRQVGVGMCWGVNHVKETDRWGLVKVICFKMI